MKLRIEVTHKLDDAQLAQIIAAIRPPEPVAPMDDLLPLTPEQEAMRDFEIELTKRNFDDAKVRHLRNALKVVMGRRACPPEFTRAVLRDQIASEGLPIPAGF